MFKNKKREKMKIAVSLPRLSYDNVLAEKLISATKFISKELMSFKKLSRLKIKINVRRTTLGTRTLGRVTHDSKFFAQKEFVIELHSNQSTSEMITTLAHELVHIKQGVSSESFCRKEPPAAFLGLANLLLIFLKSFFDM